MVDDFNYKSLTKEEIQSIFLDMKFPLEPMRHQYISLAFAAGRRRVSLLHDVGTGKTLCALYIAKLLWKCKKILVVSPASAFGSWRRDLRYNTSCSYSFIKGSGRERKRELKKEKDVHVITYEGLKTVYAKLCSQSKGSRKWVIQDDSFIHDFDCIIFDEDHKCKTYDALQSLICYELSKRATNVIGMTGTLIDDSYLELFNIYRVVDLGKSLGTNFFAYRNRHFVKRICGNKYRGRQWVEWELKPGHDQEILDAIADVSISFSREECFELPPIQKIFKFISPSKQFLQFQKALIEKKSLHVLNKEIPIGCKIKDIAFALRELPSGFAYYGEDKQVCRLGGKNPKTEALLDLLEDSSSKIIVFYQFIEERQIISEALTKAKYRFCSVYGDQETDREEEIARFQTDKQIRVLLSQKTVANEGYDAFAANVVVFFSPLSSPKMIKQCTGRAYRKGQKRSVLVITFVLEDSLEERVIVNRSERFHLVREAEAYIRDFHKRKDKTDG